MDVSTQLLLSNFEDNVFLQSSCIVIDIFSLIVQLVLTQEFQLPMEANKKHVNACDRYPFLAELCSKHLSDLIKRCASSKPSVVIVSGGYPPVHLISHYRRLVYLNAMQRKHENVYNCVHDAFYGSELHTRVYNTVIDVVQTFNITNTTVASWKSSAIKEQSPRGQLIIYGFDDETIMHVLANKYEDFQNQLVLFVGIDGRVMGNSNLANTTVKSVTKFQLIFLLLLCGCGGFLPPIAHSSTHASNFKFLLDAYIQSNRDVYVFLQRLSEQELQHTISVANEIESTTISTGLFHKFNAMRQPSILLPKHPDDVQGKHQWRHSYYKNLFFFRDCFDPNNICEQYLYGIDYASEYFTGTPIIQYGQMHDRDRPYPYGFAPLAEDIFKAFACYRNRSECTDQGSPQTLQLTQLDALALTYHPDMYFFLDELVEDEKYPLVSMCLNRMAREAHPFCMDLFPCTYHVNTYMKRNAWECVPIVPPLDIQRVLTYINDSEYKSINTQPIMHTHRHHRPSPTS